MTTDILEQKMPLKLNKKIYINLKTGTDETET